MNSDNELILQGVVLDRNQARQRRPSGKEIVFFLNSAEILQRQVVGDRIRPDR
ncbi:hypothetical protein D3C72_2439550 [compost metagenome]